MKRYLGMILLALVATTAGLRGQGLDDQYFMIFNLIQEADGLSTSEPAKAVGKYVQAQTALQRFQKGNPDWNPQVISFRLGYVARKLAALSSSAPGAAPIAASETNKPPQVTTATPAVEPSTNALGDLQSQVAALNEQVKQMQSDRALLEAKLKEALAAQPAQSDPRELARAEERIQALQKELELLKASVEEKPKLSAADAKSLQQAQLALAEANRQAAEQKELNTRLVAEKEALQARLKSSPDVAALQAENEVLKKQVLAAASTVPAAAAPNDSARQLSEAQAQIATLQSDKELLRLEKAALEMRVKQLGSSAIPASATQPAATAPDVASLRQWEHERNDLQKKLDAALNAAYGKKGKAAADRMRELELQLSTARARLEVLEARQVPYTAEELALLKLPQTPEPRAVAAELPQSKPSRRTDLRPEEIKLMTEAQSYFSKRQFEKAEAAYTQLLKSDPRNQLWLANLAAVQCESGKLEAAENSAKAAVAENPEHVFSLITLGLTHFRQKKYDDALDDLGRAAKLDSQNAEIQNHLGLTLAEKGMRVPAESAFRKAVQLQPSYAQAHYNLAVSYALQTPAAVELARFHYQKALALGGPRNAQLEQKLGTK